MAELKVSGHLMTLDTGLYCITASGQSRGQTGLPGVRISRPPGANGRPDSVAISTFQPDGWVAIGDAGLVRITDGPAQVMITVYQGPDAGPDQAPRLAVLPLSGDAAAAARPGSGAQAVSIPATGTMPEVVAHIQRMGDVAGQLGEWMGTRGSRLWIEGFGIAPTGKLKPSDIEYQGVLGKDWMSPWVEGGKFCGSRGMALPLLGLNVRLKGPASGEYDLSYSASFADGSTVGPIKAGEPCMSDSLAALEAFLVVVTPKGQRAAAATEAAPASAAPEAPARRRGAAASPPPAKKPAKRR